MEPEPVLRIAARAVVLDPDDRILLVHFRAEGNTWWATPGGALNPGETHEDAVRRELREEAGIRAPIGAHVWNREHVFQWGEQLIRQREQYFLVRVENADVVPELSAAALAEEAIHEHRWWTSRQLATSSEEFAPRRLPELLRGLLRDGPPPKAFDAGV